MSKSIDLNKGFSKLSDVLKSRDRAFQHLKNIQDMPLKDTISLTKELFFRTSWKKKRKDYHVKGYGTIPNKGMIALDRNPTIKL